MFYRLSRHSPTPTITQSLDKSCNFVNIMQGSVSSRKGSVSSRESSPIGYIILSNSGERELALLMRSLRYAIYSNNQTSCIRVLVAAGHVSRPHNIVVKPASPAREPLSPSLAPGTPEVGSNLRSIVRLTMS